MEMLDAVRHNVEQMREQLLLLDSSLASLDPETVTTVQAAQWILALAEIQRDLEYMTADVRGELDEEEEEEEEEVT